MSNVAEIVHLIVVTTLKTHLLSIRILLYLYPTTALAHKIQQSALFLILRLFTVLLAIALASISVLFFTTGSTLLATLVATLLTARLFATAGKGMRGSSPLTATAAVAADPTVTPATTRTLFEIKEKSI